jgi:1-acyl-sn-glycerol-3-phosphate acyltransferase
MRRIVRAAAWVKDSTETLVRRCISVPTVLLLFVFATLAAPLALPSLVVVDMVHRRRFARTRAYLLLWLYGFCDTVGIMACAYIPLRHAGRREAYAAAHWKLEAWWGNTLFRGAVRIFGIKLTIEGAELGAGGPVLVFPRHVSPVDNLLPLYLVSAPHGVRLRWVINRWLQRDPCIDIIGHRLPNLFVSTARKGKGEALGVAKLGEDLGPGEGVLVFPEGALYTAERREALLRRFQVEDPGLYERARHIRYMLPPRLGGVLGLLEAAPQADVLFIGHYGLEGARKYTSIAWGALVRADLRIKLWRVPAAEIPETADERTAWLFEWWKRMDDWVAEIVEEGQPEVVGTVAAGGG